MPFLRVIRDKRGYETTYLMDWYRDGPRQRSKILYVFRTPGGARVGRALFEPEVRREIEALHPDVEFDWNAIFGSQQVVEPAADVRRPRKVVLAPEGEAAPSAGRRETEAEPRESRPVDRFRSPVPAVIEGATPDEQVVFLSHWYGVIKDRISQRSGDPERQQALLALNERLNPVPWTDADAMTSGLQDAAEALARLSRLFSRRRRGGRRPPGSGRPDLEQSSVSPATTAEGTPSTEP